jgi:Zn-dependent peptidase ImmA (M78 family)
MHRNEKLHVDSRFPVALRNEVSSLAIDDREIEANQFAAELLMPEELLDRDIAALPTELEVDEAISRLAKRYIVSVQAMTLRLTALRILC